MVKVAIAHEGKTDKSLDNSLLKLLIKDLNLQEEKVEFFGFGAKSNFFKQDNDKYKRLKLQIDEEEISKILFVIDADFEKKDTVYGGYENTTNKLKEVLLALNIEEEISDIYVTCNPQTKDGYLESLILSTISKEQKECIESFLECSEFESKENHKAILNSIYNIAYPNAPYDFEHENFDELKQKLKNLLQE